MKTAIIIPAYNEELRLKKTLDAYYAFLIERCKRGDLDGFELIIVPNGCRDATEHIAREFCATHPYALTVVCDKAGKGHAIATGFHAALLRDHALIGFVDADMATLPHAFFELVTACRQYDGAIASRYMPQSIVIPPRPWIKRWGSRFIYEPLIYVFLGLKFYDMQCGAKLFRPTVIEKIVPLLKMGGWTCDIEILYLCKKFGFTIVEIPTIWEDQAGSKLSIMTSGLSFLRDIITIKKLHRHDS